MSLRHRQDGRTFVPLSLVLAGFGCHDGRQPTRPFCDVWNPAAWPINFHTLKAGYAESYGRHQFTADATLDIELSGNEAAVSPDA